MARGNLIQGQGSGKIGDVVLMVRNGQQVSRVYTTSGSRSGKEASEASRLQRVKFGSASNQWSLYRYVCTRMFRTGRTSRQSDYNYFVKRNQPLFPYLTKQENMDSVHVLQPGQFSEGTLGRIELVHVLNASPAASGNILQIVDVNASSSANLRWSGVVSSLKNALQMLYPMARKVTYLFSLPSEVTISEGGVTFVSQFITHHTVIIDLYEETVPGENQQTISNFFAGQVSNSALKALFNGQADNTMLYGHILLLFANTEGTDVNFASNVACLVFATDDTASDCYSTILQDTSIPTTAGPYAVWAGYRTNSSLRIAADSYGYQSGVMRDDIAARGNELSEQITQYINKVRAYDTAVAAALEKSLKSGVVQAKTVRTATEEK